MPDEPREPGTLVVEDELLRAGFTQIPNAVLRARSLSRDAKLLYGILLSYAWRDGACFPGYDRLTGDLQCGRSQLSKWIQELRAGGYIDVKRRGQGKTSIYTIKKLQESQNGTSRSPDPGPPAVPRRDGEEDPEEDPQVRTSNLRKQPTSDRSSGTAPATGLNDTTVPTTPIPKLLRARLPPEERRRYDADRRRIVDYLSDFARELGDAAPLASSVTRAVNLMHRAGVDLEAFTEALYHARAVTKERWAAVRKEEREPGRPFPKKQAIAYFFAELEHALGLRELPEAPAEHAAREEAEAQERRRDRDRHPDWARAQGPRDWVQTYKPGEGLPVLEADSGAADGA